jgi:hypothetical protein
MCMGWGDCVKHIEKIHFHKCSDDKDIIIEHLLGLEPLFNSFSSLFFCSTGDCTQSLTLARQALLPLETLHQSWDPFLKLSFYSLRVKYY